MSGFSINVTTQSGNLTRDPELRSLPSGTSVCNLGIAVNESYKDKDTGEWEERAHFFNWTVWGGLGEWCARELRKGDGICLSGRARWHDWEDKDGNKRSAVDFVADSIMPRSDGGGGGGGQRQQRQAEQQTSGFSARSDIPSDDFGKSTQSTGGGTATQAPPDDDIPFMSIFPEWDDLKDRGR